MSRRNEYIYGSAAPATAEPSYWEVQERREELRRQRERERREELRAEREYERAVRAARLQSVVAVLMLCFLTVSVVWYVQLMSKVSVSENAISSLETRIENLKMQNDQDLEEINSNINLEEIKEIAINELGMKYADSSQIVTYESGAEDYVHQVRETGN